MTYEPLPGRPGNLTQEQEDKLRKFWLQIFRVCGVATDVADEVTNQAEEASASDAVKAEKDKKKKRGFFSRKGKKDSEATPTSPDALGGIAAAASVKDGDEDKYGQNKVFLDALASQSPETIRETIWSMVKHDHPDALVLRFLRARKWDIDKALVMLVSTMQWRAKEVHVDDDIIKHGEEAALRDELGNDVSTKSLGHDFLAQIRMGKSFIHGTDKVGRPICIVRVRLHRQGEQAEESLERYTVYLIETARMVLNPPVDTATIIFDMTSFSMANMDYTPVKFMIKCFEANYPESLGIVLVHKAPWLFQGIWKIIRGWLDPVVASKVHFTNNKKEMEEFIAPSQILKELDGDEAWEYQYVEPIPGENDKMKDTATRDELLGGREKLYRAYEEATMEWIHSHDGEVGQTVKTKRDEIAAKLRESYWAVDPYIRARSYYDRVGVLQPGGKLDYYPKPLATVEQSKTNGTSETQEDDVD